MRDVLVNDRIGFYTQDIVIGSLSHQLTWYAPFLINPEGVEVDIKDFDARIFECLHDILLRKLLECRYLEDCDAQLMRNKIAEGSKAATAAFLITMFPNLRSMRVHFTKLPDHREEDPYHPYVQDMLVKIAKASSVSKRAICSSALSRLSAVEIHSGLDFGDLLLCAALPSLRCIGGKKLSCGRLVGLPGADLSRLQIIKLSKSYINCAGLIKGLGRVKALKVFGFHNASLDFQPGKILMELTESAAHSLIHLTLTTSSNPEKRINMASFHCGLLWRFRVLQEIHVHRNTFYRPLGRTEDAEEGEPSCQTYQVDQLMARCPNRSKSAACRGAG